MENTYTCSDCMDRRNGNCFGKKTKCVDFRFAPTISAQERSYWPEYGAATYYRMMYGREEIREEY